MITVRGHALASVLSALEAVDFTDKEYGRVSCNYRLCGDQLIRTRTPGGLLRFVRSLGMRDAPTVRLPFRADRILIKNNIRAFGLRSTNKKTTAKVALSGPMRKGNLLREIRAHRFLRKINSGIRVPRLESYDRRSGHWLLEQQIEEKKTVPRELKAQSFLTGNASRFYGHTARLRSINDRLSAEAFERLRIALPRKAAAASLFGLRWPVAFSHGDLSAGNMLWCRAEDAVYLVDWEKAGVRSVAADLRKLFAKFPVLREPILHLIRDLAPTTPRTAPPKVQMAVALAEEVALAHRQRQQRLDYLTSSRTRNYQEARAKFGRKLSCHERLIEELLA